MVRLLDTGKRTIFCFSFPSTNTNSINKSGILQQAKSESIMYITASSTSTTMSLDDNDGDARPDAKRQRRGAPHGAEDDKCEEEGNFGSIRRQQRAAFEEDAG